ncbi:UNVERIFIED_CONTAM: hypothetical protein GTU68_060390 [Idotea baltica]|nr:hypothetical protein [Idotea baltica]
MSLAQVFSRAQLGIDAPLITVEAHLTNGLPSWTLVGLPETTVRESKDRVRSAIINSNLEFPGRRITLNLAPADLPKEGGRFDIAIALSLLAASGQIPLKALSNIECIGELALSGNLLPVKGVLPAALAARRKKTILIVPQANAEEASLASGLIIITAKSLYELVAHFRKEVVIPSFKAKGLPGPSAKLSKLTNIAGQVIAKRALIVCAAGEHNLLLTGPPGTGKTLLATQLPHLLPQLTEQEALEVATIYSISGYSTLAQRPTRPFRHPHHSASAPALVGGGSHPKPGEITLAHHGVLFLDELPEFDRKVLEVLREPLESKQIIIARSQARTRYPASFQLIAAMNPCPCGFLGDSSGKCQCTPTQVQRYKNKLSGPLLDRIDLHITMSREIFSLKNIQESTNLHDSSLLIQEARDIQQKRQQCTNAQLSIEQMYKYCQLSTQDQHWLETASERLTLSLRSVHRVLKVARTLADIQMKKDIERHHLAEALQYRQSS